MRLKICTEDSFQEKLPRREALTRGPSRDPAKDSCLRAKGQAPFLRI